MPAGGTASTGGGNGEGVPEDSLPPQANPRDYAEGRRVRNHRWVRQTLDGLGRTIKEERGYGGVFRGVGVPVLPEVVESIVETEYVPCACGPFGKAKRVSRPRRLATDPKVWTEWVYDWAGRALQVKHAPVTGTGAAGSQGTTVSEFTVEGSPARAAVKVTDPAGRWKKSFTDGFGDLVQVTEPKPGGGEYLTSYTYSALGKLRTVTMTRDGHKNGIAGQYTQTRTFHYNADGTVQSTVFPETGTTSYTYSGGRAETQTDALGRMRKWLYQNGRLQRIERHYAGVERTSERTEWTYDAYGRVSEVSYGNGPAGRVTEALGWTSAGQPEWKELRFWNTTLRAEWTYDAEGRAKTVKYPQGNRFILSYDAADRVSALHKEMAPPASAELQASVEWDWRGMLTRMTRPDGWGQDWAYNEGGLMTSYNLSAGTAVTYDYGTTSPVAGKLASSTQNGNAVSYSYDSLGRLSSATSAAWTQGYSYDGFGNLRQKTGTMAVDWTGQLNSERNVVGSADAAGNAVGPVWDADNRMQGNGEWSYAYDASGQRVLEVRGTPTGHIVVATLRAGGSVMGRYSYETTGSGTPVLVDTKEYRYLAGRRIDVGTDRLGSDLSGGRVLLPYGEQFPTPPPPNPYTLHRGSSLTFATYWRDEASGLDYADQRYYGPGTGRFLSADPYQASAGASAPGSWNRYAYVEGDPVNYRDRRGLVGEDLIDGDDEPGCLIDGVPYNDDFCNMYLNSGGGDKPQAKPGGGGGTPLSPKCENGLKGAKSDRASLDRANAQSAALKSAATKHGIDWRLLAAIGVKESNFKNDWQKDESGKAMVGHGAGVFQIDLSKNPGVAAGDAFSFEWAANWAAKTLSSNYAYFKAKFNKFDEEHLLQATAASWNLGKDGISGNPNTIDVGSKPNDNYGSLTMMLMDCFR